MAPAILVNLVSGDALQLSDDTEPLLEPVLTYQRGPQLFIPGKCYLEY